MFTAIYARPSYGNNLSPKELAVLKLMSEGKGRKDIAHELHRAETTINTQQGSIYAKLQVSGLTQPGCAAVSKGYRMGLLS